jgi:DNA-binding transcriptional LysR family regulator
MRTKSRRGVPHEEHDRSPGGLPDWDAARTFLQVARAGSLRAAAGSLGHSVNAVRRKLQHLEENLGTALLSRHTDGIRLTEEGRRVLAIAENMEMSSFQIVREAKGTETPLAHEVKLAITEGLGTFWIVPRLPELRQLHPHIEVTLLCTMPPANVLKLEADLAVQFERPRAKDQKLVKLCRVHFMPFASREYASRRGLPKTITELAAHDIVYQSAEQAVKIEQMPAPLQAVFRNKRPVLTANTSSSVYAAVVGGLGIGMLPTYTQTLREPMIPIDIGLRTQHDLWLTYHADAGRIPRVREVMKWLVAKFSPRTYPWFEDEFMHPDDVRALAASMPAAVLGTAL